MVGVLNSGTMHQVDTYFNVVSGRLKLREIDGKQAQLIQYFRPDEAASRISDYLLVHVHDPEKLKLALERSLGIWVVVEKTRALYLWRNTRVHLDNVVGLGRFLELETVISEQSLSEGEDECRYVQEVLGISLDQLIAGSYSDMLATQGLEG